jgi:hypothetical protein
MPIFVSRQSLALKYALGMKKPPTLLITFVALLVIALLINPPQSWAQSSAGSVTAVSGTATVERAGKSFAAASGAPLQVGDKLTTGPASRLTVGMSDGSQLELNDSSMLVLTENILRPDGSRASTRVTLLNGLVRALVRVSAGNTPNFEVHTPNAVAAARGTMFDVAYYKNQPPPSKP